MFKTNRRSHGLVFHSRLPILVLSAVWGVAVGGASSKPTYAGAPAAVSVNPQEVAFETRAGSTVSLASDVNLSGSMGVPTSYTASVQSDGGWLQLGKVVSGLTVSLTSSIAATAPGTLRVVAVVQNLPVGAYSGTIYLKTPDASSSRQVISVSLVVRGDPTVIARPAAIQLHYRKGFKFNRPQPQTISILGESTKFQIRVLADRPGWLKVSPTTGTTPSDLTVSVDPSNLEPGSYDASISIIGSDESDLGAATLELEITDDAPPPTVSPRAISFKTRYGSRQPLSRSVLVSTNDDLLSLAGSATDKEWLSVKAVDQWAGAYDGKTGNVLPEPGRVIVSADPTGLAPGTYSGRVRIGDLSSPMIPVTLEVEAGNLLVPRVVAGGGWETIINLVNTDAVPAAFTLRFWRRDGTPMSISLDGIGTVSSYSEQIPTGGIRTLTSNVSAQDVSSGWAEITTQNSIGGTAVLRQNTSGAGSEVYIPVGPPTGKSFAFPYDNLAGLLTGVALINPGSEDAAITLGVFDQDGRQIAADSFSLPSHSSQAYFLPERYPQVANSRGVVKYVSQADLSAISLRFSPGGAFASFQPIVAASIGTNDVTTRSIPAISDGGGWKTTIFLHNPANYPVPFSISFRDPKMPGVLLSPPLLGIGPVPEYSDQIPAGGMRAIETPGAAKSLVQGWAQIVSSGPITGTVVLTHSGSNGADVEATLEIRLEASENLVLAFDNVAGSATGIAILKASEGSWTGTVTVRDEDGREIAGNYYETAGNLFQAYALADRYPSTKGIRGTLEFKGINDSILGVRFNPLAAFALYPPVPK